MSADAVQEVEAAITRLSPEDIRTVAEWLEHDLEDQLEVKVEFTESIRRGEAEIARGDGQIVKP